MTHLIMIVGGTLIYIALHQMLLILLMLIDKQGKVDQLDFAARLHNWMLHGFKEFGDLGKQVIACECACWNGMGYCRWNGDRNDCETDSDTSQFSQRSSEGISRGLGAIGVS